MQRSIPAIAVLALALPLAAQKTITCSSLHGRPHFCPADTSNGVLLLEEHSDGVCQQGSTWHSTRRGVTVSGGCSADFQVGGNGGNSGSSGNDQRGDRDNNNGRNSQNGNYPTNGQNNYPSNNDQNGYPNDNNNLTRYPDNRDQDRNNQNGPGSDRSNGYGNRQPAGFSIPAGTRFDVRLEQTVSVAEVNQGDIIPATLARDVSVEGRVIAPAGTAVQAKVASARGEPLDLRLDSMTVDRQTYRLLSNSVHSARDGQAAENGEGQTPGQQIGAVIGALAGGGGQLRSGSVFTFRLTSPSRAYGRNSQDGRNQ